MLEVSCFAANTEVTLTQVVLLVLIELRPQLGRVSLIAVVDIGL